MNEADETQEWKERDDLTFLIFSYIAVVCIIIQLLVCIIVTIILIIKR